jgi:hypothetical protein
MEPEALLHVKNSPIPVRILKQTNSFQMKAANPTPLKLVQALYSNIPLCIFQVNTSFYISKLKHSDSLYVAHH